MGIASVLLATALSVPAWGADPAQPGNATANPARPGSLNYVEGQASIAAQSLGPEAIGKKELYPGQALETQAGKPELLLTPGVFFRLGDNSRATMISPTLTNTELRLDKGEATVEVAELYPENNVVIAQDGAKVRLTKTGFYDFDADHYIVRVYQGESRREAGMIRMIGGGLRQIHVDRLTQLREDEVAGSVPRNGIDNHRLEFAN
jgi:hypothetical protein